jgi:hypothetical protein
MGYLFIKNIFLEFEVIKNNKAPYIGALPRN